MRQYETVIFKNAAYRLVGVSSENALYQTDFNLKCEAFEISLIFQLILYFICVWCFMLKKVSITCLYTQDVLFRQSRREYQMTLWFLLDAGLYSRKRKNPCWKNPIRTESALKCLDKISNFYSVSNLYANGRVNKIVKF